MRRSHVSIPLAALLSVSALLGITACMEFQDGNSSQKALLSSNCAVAADQRSSFMDRVRGFPLHIAIDRQFSFSERQAIVRAVWAWNASGLSLLHHELFAVDSETVDVTQMPANPAQCTVTYGSEDRFLLLKETSLSHWEGMNLTRATPGVTFRCSSGGYLFQQVLYVYPELIESSQLESVVVHELGHSLGLDHSCDDKNRGLDGFISCSSVNEGSPYHDAIMYPSLRVGGRLGVETKEAPRDNDRIRAQCIVEPI